LPLYTLPSASLTAVALRLGLLPLLLVLLLPLVEGAASSSVMISLTLAL